MNLLWAISAVTNIGIGISGFFVEDSCKRMAVVLPSRLATVG